MMSTPMNRRVYLDYAATAPVLPEIQRALCSAYTTTLGNASTLYREGRLARQALEQAREDLAATLDCAPQELYFCSGGTEAAGTLIEGIARGAREKQGARRARTHVICAAFEHHAVLDSALSLRRSGFEVELLRPNRAGYITPEALEAALRPDTLLVTAMLAQNELGTVQDIAALAALAHRAGALLVSDCVQAFGKVLLSLAALDVDAACFSAHKLGGPCGVGAFYLKPGVPFRPRQLGGGQERGLRSGTQDVPGAQGFALAAELQLAELLAGEGERLALLRDGLLAELTRNSERVRPTVPLPPDNCASHLPGYLPLLVRGIESQTMVLRLDELGFAVSGGSACSSASLEPSHVLTSLGIAKDEADGALRVSLGRDTTTEDCARFGEALLSLL
ncbi:MAG: cysteine desulfurase [Coriobacteriales bacterium]|jgi:cysteine desulfurase|nr:cysteine desulfurase [Coriobacteriales bacterium]